MDVSSGLPSSATNIEMTVVSIRNPGPNFNFRPFLEGTHPSQQHPTYMITENGGVSTVTQVTSAPSTVTQGTSAPSTVTQGTSAPSTVAQFTSVPPSTSGSSVQTIPLHGAMSVTSQRGVLPWEVRPVGTTSLQAGGFLNYNVQAAGSAGFGSSTAVTAAPAGPTPVPMMNGTSGQMTPPTPTMMQAIASGSAPMMMMSPAGMLALKRRRGRPKREEQGASYTGYMCLKCKMAKADCFTKCVPEHHTFCRTCVVPIMQGCGMCPYCGQSCSCDQLGSLN